MFYNCLIHINISISILQNLGTSGVDSRLMKIRNSFIPSQLIMKCQCCNTCSVSYTAIQGQGMIANMSYLPLYSIEFRTVFTAPLPPQPGTVTVKYFYLSVCLLEMHPTVCKHPEVQRSGSYHNILSVIHCFQNLWSIINFKHSNISLILSKLSSCKLYIFCFVHLRHDGIYSMTVTFTEFSFMKKCNACHFWDYFYKTSNVISYFGERRSNIRHLVCQCICTLRFSAKIFEVT